MSLPTQCEFPRGGTSRVTTVTLVPREGNETLRLFATPLHAWKRLASSQKLTLLCAGVPLYLPSMPSNVTSWRNTNQDWNGFIHASDALRWGGFPKVSLPTQCLVPFSGNKGYSRNPRRFLQWKSSRLNQERYMHRSNTIYKPKTIVNKQISGFWYERTTGEGFLFNYLFLLEEELLWIMDCYFGQKWWFEVIWLNYVNDGFCCFSLFHVNYSKR